MVPMDIPTTSTMDSSTDIPSPVLRNEQESSHHVLTCSLCCEVPMDPVIAPVCQHIFCRSCIQQALQSRSECPNDRRALHFSEIKSIDGALRRIWEMIPVRCPKDQCVWTGTFGGYASHASQCFASNRDSIREYERRIDQLTSNHESETQQLRQQLEICRQAVATLTAQNQDLNGKLTQGVTYSVDQSYRYDRFRIVELTQLICHYLESKPSHINSGRIYNCVRSCYDDYIRGYNDNPEHMFLDLRMLLAVCLASTWFSDKQRANMREWISKF
jgi:Zinc finger, C3HC4 type (RING finger)